ncbi:OmpA family protein [uncultured Arcticibacterium sp.]|uniref:OmpA family protein n=1 Tax=uncultured Arcticibacterium sp. TaxID=2173042 RepID=UPI0030F5A983
MSTNLLELTKGYLSNEAVDQVSEFLGENSSLISRGLSGVLPILLGGIINKISTEEGLASLMGLINLGSNSGVLGNLEGLLTNKSQSQGLLDNGSGLVSSVLGNNTGSVIDSIASFSGLKKSSTSSLLSIVTPLLMSVIGKQVKLDGLSLSGLASLLMGQKEYVKAEMPAGLSSLASSLNFEQLGNAQGRSFTAMAGIKNIGAGIFGGESMMKVLLALLIIIIGIWAYKNYSKVDVNTADVIREDVSGAVDDGVAAADKEIKKLSEFFNVKLPNGVELNIPTEGMEANLLNFISDGTVDETSWFNLDRINFESGSSNLTAESSEQVKNIAVILDAYPEVNLKVGGYTDNSGSEEGNMKLSQDRANKVMVAILANGIYASRLEAEGYGSAHPVASNESQEGKTQNRRIAVRVTQK